MENESEPNRGGLIGSCIVAATVGYLLALSGAFNILPEGQDPAESVGQVLLSEQPQLSSGEWSDVEGDLSDVQKGLAESARPVFELVVAVRGLSTEGKADWPKAQKVCEKMSWPRCGKDELEALQSWSRP